MKINGKKIIGANVVHVVIPRGNGDNIAFTCHAVLDMKEFYDLLPLPKPAMVTKPGGIQVPDPSDVGYQKRVNEYAEARFNFVFIKSITEPSKLEWETINMLAPETWGNYEQELKAAGFTFNEIQLIVNGTLEANALSESKLVEARASFLASLASTVVQPALSSPTEEQPPTPSGELASVLG